MVAFVPSASAAPCRGEFEPALFRRGALCRAETEQGLKLVDRASSPSCDWASVATQVTDQCCHAALFFQVGTCPAEGLESRFDACRRFSWRAQDEGRYQAGPEQIRDKTQVGDARPPTAPPAWMGGTFSSETPYPAVVRIGPSGRVVHLILDGHRDDSIGRGAVERVGGEWIVDLRYENSAQLSLRFERRDSGIAVAEANPLPLKEQPPPNTCIMQDTSRPGHRWARRPESSTFFYASLRRPSEYRRGALCLADTTGKGLFAVLDNSYEPCAWTLAAKKIGDECCASAHHYGLGDCRETDPDARLEECWRFSRNPW